MEIPKKVIYECDHCKKIHKSKNSLITLSGQFEGRSDLPYEFHFCNWGCVKHEFESLKKLDEEVEGETDEYYFIIEEEYEKWKSLVI